MRFPIQGELDETIIDPALLPAVRAIRETGIETLASSSGIGHIGLEHGWGSYIQVYIRDPAMVEKVVGFTDDMTEQARNELGNPGLAVQLVSAELWFEDRETTSRDGSMPIFRLQLVGHVSDDEIRHVWQQVADRFSLED